ncbi:uncharacterized protein [Chironomus tepperi]|uniref:uncharacterized protein n=1 Tax=Chironomus tepperi TaxID=113505 RepID=UPI00391F949D
MSETGATLVDVSGEFINQHILQSDTKKDEACVDVNQIPEWLNKNLLEDVLCQHFKSRDIRVKFLKVMHCGGKGENFASVMYRVGTYYFHQKSPEKIDFISCILKTLPQNDLALDKLGSGNYNVQNKEMIFYQQIIPEFEDILGTIGEDGKTFPKVMAVYLDLNLIVLEDLNERNFVMANRLKGLDMNHVKLSLKCLARMHAASVVLHDKDKNVFKNFDTGFYTRRTDAFHVFFKSSLEVLAKEIANWTDWDESSYYAKKLTALVPNLIEKGRKSFDCEDGDFNCLNQGDLWTNNVMFQYEAPNNPKKAVILDFQFFFFGSAALDLHYFLFTSVHDDMRLEKMDEMVRFYYNEVKQLLTRLNYDMKKFPSLHNFQVQVLKKLFYAFSSCMITFPIHICEDEEADFEALMCTDARAIGFKSRIYANPRFKQIAMKMLPMFDGKGVLDEL